MFTPARSTHAARSLVSRSAVPPRRKSNLACTLALLAVPCSLFPALTGCRVGPNYVKPAAPTAPAFKEIDPSWSQAAPADSIPKGPWWTLFNDPGLNALEPKVAASNQDIRVAEANFRAARAAIRMARTRSCSHPYSIAPQYQDPQRLSANQPYGSSNSNHNLAVVQPAHRLQL